MKKYSDPFPFNTLDSPSLPNYTMYTGKISCQLIKYKKTEISLSYTYFYPVQVFDIQFSILFYMFCQMICDLIQQGIINFMAYYRYIFIILKYQYIVRVQIKKEQSAFKDNFRGNIYASSFGCVSA